MKRTHCVFVYATKAARQAGEMEYTVDADGLDEANEIAQQELDEGMYCASIYQRMPNAAPMQFVGAHILPQVPVPKRQADMTLAAFDRLEHRDRRQLAEQRADVERKARNTL